MSTKQGLNPLDHSDKTWLDREIDLQNLLEDIKKEIGDFPVLKNLGTDEIPEVSIFGNFKSNRKFLINSFYF